MFYVPSVLALSVNLEGSNVGLVPLIVTVMVGLVFIVPAALFRKWYFYRRRLRKSTITAEYEPPLGLNPAEIGYLFDGKLRQQEVGATIIHLVQRGFLHLKKVDGQKKIFAGPRVDDNLKTYEKKLIEEADKPDGVSATDLLSRFTTLQQGDKKTYGTRELIFTQLVHADLHRKQYVKGSFAKYFIAGALKIAVILQFILIFIPLIITFIYFTYDVGSADFTVLVGLLFIGVMVAVFSFIPFFIAAMILNYIRGRILGREWIITKRLSRLWPQIIGYRQYIKLVEKDRLDFQTKSMESSSKNDTLPYAVALGYVKNWKNIIS